MTTAARCMTWTELLPALDRSGAPDFIAHCCDQEIRAAAGSTPHAADPTAS